ncbi:MAG: hypothetical protein FWF31_06640 [Desulfobulbus sp.]|nr:hypothetical protein [Desulfobulbus sp.]
MLTPTTFASTSLISTYDRSGRPEDSLRSVPVRLMVVPGDQGGATADKYHLYQDLVSLSPDSIEKSRKNEDSGNEEQSATGTAKTGGSPQEESASTDPQQLTEAETKTLRKLQARDREVKAHEMAHLTNAGQYARGGASYTYQQGPDGQEYAIGGEVSIDIGKESTPEKTIQKMEVVKRAALAPADPSAADRAIAAKAAATEDQARQELQTQQNNDAGQQQTNDAPTGWEDDQTLSSPSRSTVASEQRMKVNAFA